MKCIALILTAVFLFFDAKSDIAGDYRSVSSGDWYSISVWEKYNGITFTWEAATTVPSNDDGTITILHSINANTAIIADQLIIDAAGTLTILSTFTVSDGPGYDITCNGSLILTSTLAGTGTTIINGNLSWTLGTLSSPVIIASTGILHSNTPATKALSSVLTNDGLIDWSSGNINFNNGTLNNNGTINIIFDGTFSDFGGVNIFNNSGTVNKSISTGTTSFNIPSNNTGILNVTSGTIATTVGITFNSGTLLSGNGALLLNGTVNVNAAVSTPGTLLIRKSSGTTTGTAMFTVNGSMSWTGGTLGSFFTIASGAILTASSSTKTLSGIMIMDGTMNWTAGDINFSNGSLTNNGTITNSFNGSFSNTSGTNSFNNSGNFSKTGGTGNTTIGIPTTNSGTINVNSGTVFKNSTGITNTGTINISAASTFTSNITLTLNTGTVINGNGSLTLDGTVHVNTALSPPSTLTINKPNGSSTSGTGLFTVSGIMNWLGGTIGSPFTIAAGATLNASSATKAVNSTLINNGTLNWSGGNYNFNTGTLNNNGTIDNSFDGLFSVFSGINSFNNNGIFKKSGSTGTTIIAIPATNSGNLTGQGGITFNNTFTNNGMISPGTTLGTLTIATSSSPVFSSASSLNIEMLDGSGPGSGNDLFVSNANLLLNGALNITETGTVPDGTYTIISLTAGSITGNFASLALPSGYVLNMESTRVTLTKSSLLPVHLINLTGKMNDDKIDLVWQTTLEENFNRFEIEKSENGSIYQLIGSVRRQNNNGSVKIYAFSDLNPYALHNFYRLKMIDEDGKYSYSRVVEIMGNTIVDALKIYPNPSSGKFFISLSPQWLNADVLVSNAAGQFVLSRKISTPLIWLNLNSQPDGIYWLRITKNKQSIIQTLIKKVR